MSCLEGIHSGDAGSPCGSPKRVAKPAMVMEASLVGTGGRRHCKVSWDFFIPPARTDRQCTSAHLSLARPDPRTSLNSKEAGRSVLHVLRTQHLGGELVNLQRLGCVGWGSGVQPPCFLCNTSWCSLTTCLEANISVNTKCSGFMPVLLALTTFSLVMLNIKLEDTAP